MENLKISLFGGVRIIYGSSNQVIKLPHKTSALLSYILLQRYRTHSRDVLAGLFWGEQPQSRAHDCLNTALWRLRKALEPEGVPAGTYLLGTYSDEIGINPASEFWLDVAVFEEQTKQILTLSSETSDAADIEILEKSLALYTADLLEGYYDDWALYERERLRALYIDSLIFLLQHCSSHADYEKGIRFAQKILQLDPLREEVHRKLMEIYAACGKRMEALQQYNICRRLLMEELDIPPLEETQALYYQIKTGAPAGRGKAVTVAELQEQLQKVQGVIANLENQVQQIIQLVEGLYR